MPSRSEFAEILLTCSWLVQRLSSNDKFSIELLTMILKHIRMEMEKTRNENDVQFTIEIKCEFYF